MLTNETRKIAERIAEEFKPLFKKAEKLQKEQREAAKKAKRCRYIARVWQYAENGWNDFDLDLAEMTEAEAKEAQKISQENPKEWIQILDNKYMQAEEAETLEKVANINLINYLNYLAKLLFIKVRPDWQKFNSKKGFESLGKLLSGGSFRVYFVRDNQYCASWEGLYYIIRIVGTPWACRGECWAPFYNSEKNTNESEPTAPTRLTRLKYLATVKEIKELEEKARIIYNKQRAIFSKYGALSYYVGGLKYPTAETDSR